mgnify:CR=1 FL=1
MPQVFNQIVEYSDEIKKILRNPTQEMILMIKEFNPELLKHKDMFEGWLKMCITFAKENEVPLLEWIKQKPNFTFSKH